MFISGVEFEFGINEMLALDERCYCKYPGIRWFVSFLDRIQKQIVEIPSHKILLETASI